MTETEAVIESVVAAKFEEQQRKIENLEANLWGLGRTVADLLERLMPKKAEIIVGTDDSCDYSGSD